MIPALRMWLVGMSMLALSATSAAAQAVAGPEKAQPVKGDPGISSMVVLDQPGFRILRDYAEPGATRRMHAHADATYHVFVLITGQLQLTVDGTAPVTVTPGEALSLDGGARHTFTNTGPMAATIVEVFGKAPAGAGDADRLAALAAVLAAPPPTSIIPRSIRPTAVSPSVSSRCRTRSSATCVVPSSCSWPRSGSSCSSRARMSPI